VFISVRSEVNPRAGLEALALGQMNIPMTSSGKESVNFWLVAQYLRSNSLISMLLHHAVFFLGLSLDSKNGGDMFLRNVG
jgi:hypothetical protein